VSPICATASSAELGGVAIGRLSGAYPGIPPLRTGAAEASSRLRLVPPNGDAASALSPRHTETSGWGTVHATFGEFVVEHEKGL
jgi:hypothetical protein